MKFVHLGDIHIGKRVNGYSMLEDQKFVFNEILEIIDEEKPDAVLIAGDLYDKTVPAAEAVNLCDDFIVRLAKKGRKVFVISGNHDSADRVAFGGRLMMESGVYVSPVYDGSIKWVETQDEYGPVRVYLIPFLKPAMVRPYAGEEAEKLQTFNEAMKYVVEGLDIDPSVRNIALAHQFISGSSICDSEDLSIGGLDEVDKSVFDCFDYVALGHLHGPQKVGRETMRYAGSPIKYSFSEIDQKKSVTLVEMGAKEDAPVIRLIPLKPLHEMRELRGTFEEITARENLEKLNREDYYHITLTDEQDVHMAASRLRDYYFPNMMLFDYDNTRTRNLKEVTGASAVKEKTPEEIFGEFYMDCTGREMSDKQKDYFNKLLQRVMEVAE